MAAMTLDRRPDETARLRRLILRPKALDREDAGWRQPPVPARLLPFGRTLKLGSDWKWRHLTCSAGDDRFLLLGRVNMRKGITKPGSSIWTVRNHACWPGSKIMPGMLAYTFTLTVDRRCRNLE